MEFQILDILAKLHTPVLTEILKLLTASGEYGIIWILACLLLICFRQTRLAGIAALLALIFMYLAGDVFLKPLIARERPYITKGIEILISAPSGYSFPSGHTASSFAAACTYLYYHKKIGIAGLVTAILMAFSRLYFYVHYPTDIIGGIALGILCSALAVIVIKKLSKKINFFG